MVWKVGGTYTGWGLLEISKPQSILVKRGTHALFPYLLGGSLLYVADCISFMATFPNILGITTKLAMQLLE